MVLLRFAGELPLVQVAAGGFYLMLGLTNLGSLLEGRSWVRTLELARLVTLLAACGALLAVPRFSVGMVGLVAGFGLFSIAWLLRIGPTLGRAEPAPA